MDAPLDPPIPLWTRVPAGPYDPMDGPIFFQNPIPLWTVNFFTLWILFYSIGFKISSSQSDSKFHLRNRIQNFIFAWARSVICFFFLAFFEFFYDPINEGPFGILKSFSGDLGPYDPMDGRSLRDPTPPMDRSRGPHFTLRFQLVLSCF